MKKFWVLTLLLSFLFGTACGHNSEQKKDNPSEKSITVQKDVLVTNELDLDFSKHKVTFIELGADICIPCKAMQPIMKEIAEEYASKIQVVFYDVWKDPRPARKYRIRLIPTQVFIDKNGGEIFRHVGFFSKEEILKMLKEKGII